MELKEKAFNKIHSKLLVLDFEINSLKEDLKTGNTGGIDTEQLLSIIQHTEKEKLIYLYLFSLIEKDR